jgi:hypothetical protein
MLNVLNPGAVYTMDHEVGPRLCKAADWLLKLFQDNFGVHQEKNGRGTMKVKVPKIYIRLRPNKCIDMVQRVLR